MSVPGPPGDLWAGTLLLWAVSASVVGEAVRGTAARWVPLWRSPEPLERFLLDFYLGGATLYLVAALELGAFVRPVVFALPLAAGSVVVYRAGAARRDPARCAEARGTLQSLADRWLWVALLSGVALYVVELAAALPIGTGNTYDASLLTTYVTLLIQHGSLPISFQPYGAPAILYPQGTTVWLAWAQLDFGLPAARTSLLVTPLFLGLAPLAGFVLGRRLVGGSRAGAALALSLAWLGPSTRALVGGSNDFVFALPLVLLLAAQGTTWARAPLGRWGDAIGYGLLLGYSAALNVTGVEWLLPALLLLGALGRPTLGGSARAWLARWGAAAAVTLLAGLPSLYVLVQARLRPSLLAGALSAPSSVRVGIDLAQLVGSVDPFLFRAGDVELSPIPLLRLELAILLVLGAAGLLYLAIERPDRNPWTPFSRWAVSAASVLVLWLGIEVVAGLPGSPIRPIAFVSSAPELSLWLFTVFGLVAAVPLGVALERAAAAGADEGSRPASPRSFRGGWLWARFPAIAFSVVVVVPAVVLTPVSLGPVLTSTYQDFGNVSAADFQLFDYAAAHFAPGVRVLVAPGSGAEFLPGYAPGIVLLYPMAPGLARGNVSYGVVVQELSNGTLDARGLRALANLSVDRVVVTGNNTVLWPAFWAAPLVSASANGTRTFPVLWHQDDAWVFNATACRPGSAGCP